MFNKILFKSGDSFYIKIMEYYCRSQKYMLILRNKILSVQKLWY